MTNRRDIPKGTATTKWNEIGLRIAVNHSEITTILELHHEFRAVKILVPYLPETLREHALELVRAARECEGDPKRVKELAERVTELNDFLVANKGRMRCELADTAPRHIGLTGNAARSPSGLFFDFKGFKGFKIIDLLMSWTVRGLLATESPTKPQQVSPVPTDAIGTDDDHGAEHKPDLDDEPDPILEKLILPNPEAAAEARRDGRQVLPKIKVPQLCLAIDGSTTSRALMNHLAHYEAAGYLIIGKLDNGRLFVQMTDEGMLMLKDAREAGLRAARTFLERNASLTLMWFAPDDEEPNGPKHPPKTGPISAILLAIGFSVFAGAPDITHASNADLTSLTGPQGHAVTYVRDEQVQGELAADTLVGLREHAYQREDPGEVTIGDWVEIISKDASAEGGADLQESFVVTFQYADNGSQQQSAELWGVAADRIEQVAPHVLINPEAFDYVSAIATTAKPDFDRDVVVIGYDGTAGRRLGGDPLAISYDGTAGRRLGGDPLVISYDGVASDQQGGYRLSY